MGIGQRRVNQLIQPVQIVADQRSPSFIFEFHYRVCAHRPNVDATLCQNIRGSARNSVAEEVPQRYNWEMQTAVRHLLVPGGGGSGPAHWHHRWAQELPNCEWVRQVDQSGGTRSDWVEAIDVKVNELAQPAILIAHSLACIAVAHWAASRKGPVVAALLVAPADIDDDWAEPDSLYKRFQPIALQPLLFPATVVASTNDPLLSIKRAEEFATAWGAHLEMIGDHLHVGSDAHLGEWPVGRTVLADLTERASASET